MQSIIQAPQALVATLLGLGLLGTGLAYICYYYIIEQLGALTASSVTYIPPIVALAIGAGIMGETIEAVFFKIVGTVCLKFKLLHFLLYLGLDIPRSAAHSSALFQTSVKDS